MVEALPVQFVAPDGVMYSVHEIDDPLSPRGRCLMFVGRDVFRRVRDYPDGWRELSGPELWALSWNT